MDISGEKLDGIDSEAAAQKLRGRVGTFVTVKLKKVSTILLSSLSISSAFFFVKKSVLLRSN